MIKNKRRFLLFLISIISATIILSGCNGSNTEDELMNKSKEELVQLVRGKESQINSDQERIAELEGMLQGLGIESNKTPAISEFKDGTGRTTFNSIDGKIIFPVPFQYPESTQSPNTSSVNIASGINIKPTNNWLLKLDGTRLYLEHTSGIVGEVYVATISKSVAISELQSTVISPFFKDFPPYEVSYSKIFLNEAWSGIQADTKTNIDEKESKLKCGMITSGYTQISYMFLYNGVRDSSKDEMITTLLNTITVNGNQFKVE